MIGTGWEIWGVNASMLLITLAAGALALLVRLISQDSGTLAHVDGMAGDEGED